MHGMDDGPWTALGHVRLVPRRLGRDDGGDDVPLGRPDRRAVRAHDQERLPLAPVAFTAGYLLTWAAAGVAAFLIGGADRLAGESSPGTTPARMLAGATLLVAAVYELTPLKNVCLGKCRSPLGFLLGSWRDGWLGALRMGRRTAPGASAVAGPSWPHCSRWAS